MRVVGRAPEEEELSESPPGESVPEQTGGAADKNDDPAAPGDERTAPVGEEGPEPGSETEEETFYDEEILPLTDGGLIPGLEGEPAEEQAAVD